MEEKLNEMVIENTINEVEENLADEVVQTATKNNGVVTGLVIGGIALAGFAIYKVIKTRRNAKHNQEVEVEDDEFFEEETETED
jgi:hypothetical protein